MSSSMQQQMLLKQMSYLCPGLHGPESRQRIERRTFGDFMDSPETGRIIIPLFQRRYCWEERRVRGWWTDVVCGKRDHLGIHNTGNVVVKKSAADGDAWICIDGQQRLTTTSLLVAALRDALLVVLGQGGGQEQCRTLLNTMDSVLYHDPKGAAEFATNFSSPQDGADLAFCRLVPSYSDRKSFFFCITEGLTRHSEVDYSLQRSAKRIFDVQVNARLAPLLTTEAKVTEIQSLTELALTKMGLTLVEVQNEIVMPQVFLWLQEKSLFGEGALLYNPSPGVDFTASDLIRNLFLSSVMGERLKYQEEFYRDRWLFPLENKFSGPDALTSVIAEYAEEQTKNKSGRHVSKLEETALSLRKMIPCKGKVDHMMIYAKFYSVYEERLRQSVMLPPRTMQQAKKKRGSSEEEWQIDVKSIVKVSTQLLEEMIVFIALGEYK